MDEIIQELREYIAYRVVEGFEAKDEIIENAIFYAADVHGREDLDQEISNLVDDEFDAHYQRQSQWTTPTDCDKLEAAFGELNKCGIVARQNFTCCNNCGHTEIWDEIDVVSEEQEVIGYAFYHQQATETAIESGSLYITFGPPEENLINIGKRVTHSLRQAGLQVEWNGRADGTIEVRNLDWKRRRT